MRRFLFSWLNTGHAQSNRWITFRFSSVLACQPKTSTVVQPDLSAALVLLMYFADKCILVQPADWSHLDNLNKGIIDLWQGQAAAPPPNPAFLVYLVYGLLPSCADCLVVAGRQGIWCKAFILIFRPYRPNIGSRVLRCYIWTKDVDILIVKVGCNSWFEQRTV